MLAMVDPSNTSVLDEIKFLVGVHVVPIVAMESDILLAIRRLYHHDKGPLDQMRSAPGTCSSQAGSVSKLSRQAQSYKDQPRFNDSPSLSFPELQACLEEVTSSFPAGEEVEWGFDGAEDRAPIVHLVNRLIDQARQAHASDVHIEPYADFVRVRFRLDGMLRTVMHLPKSVQQAIVARIKIMSCLNIAEHRLPQDGRMRVKSEGIREYDIRVSILPCFHGEKAVLRILDRSCLNLDLEQLGFDSVGLSIVMNALEVPHGMILVTGPTGSGKTTTLYSALQFLNSPGVNIVTVEDPVEYQLPGINQLQTKDDIGLSFAAGLRSFLRQDPDVIMVGEIRDRETANIAVQAALTGHRVFSTLHTTDAIRAVTRLLDMGIEPFLVSSALTLVIAQRLIRKICEECREPDLISLHQLKMLGLSEKEAGEVTPMRGVGCLHCQGTGFKGRIPLFEILSFSDELHDKVLQRAPSYEMKACARRLGFNSLRMSGLEKIKLGVTTVDEVMAVTSVDD